MTFEHIASPHRQKTSSLEGSCAKWR
ncbi:unnamed protein product [Ectocarpus sp. CCAP 1310/34]|nr:unnamed protein product [Ectocarpus sp. CCAP 1310/34]